MNVVSEETIVTLIRRATRDFELTAAEQREVCALLVGFSCKESAAKQGISADTTRQRRKRLYLKLQVHSDAQAVTKVVGFHRAWPPPHEKPEPKRQPPSDLAGDPPPLPSPHESRQWRQG
jgi:DNA-binding CsgD family transcriptional regulator